MAWLDYLEAKGYRDLEEGCCTPAPKPYMGDRDLKNGCCTPAPNLYMENVLNRKKENDDMKKTVVTKPTGKPAEPTFKCENTYTITKVEVFNDRAVKMTFDDGTYVTAVCAENDIFNLDVGITICLAKRMMRGRGSGTKNYNKAIKLIHRMMDRQQKAKEEEAANKKALQEKRERQRAKIEAKKQAHREELIAIQEEAYRRAMAKEDDLK